MNYLPSKLVKMRKHFNYSQGKLAEVLGVDTLEYMGYENGRLIISHDQIKKLASFYHVSFDDIFKNSDEIELDEVEENTDELNIDYFLPKRNIFQRFISYCKRKPLVPILLSILLVAGIAGIINLINYLNVPPIEVLREDINILDVSNTSVVYIDQNGGVLGRGNNTNGQLENLPQEKIVKVCEAATFTVCLNNEGKLSSVGLMEKHANTIASWNNIVDVAVGDGHIIAVDNRGKTYCTGDNTYRQCKIDEFNNIKKVFASPKGSIGINADGKLVYAGETLGISSLKNIDNIIDLDFSDDNTVVLKDNNTVTYYAKTKNFRDVETWRNVIDVACGNDFIAALTEDGKVLISIDNYIIEKEVDSWENIKVIAAANDYMVAYDGERIYGIGNNLYNQFDKSENLIVSLPQVSDVRISFENNDVLVKFKGVPHATGYLVSIDAGIGISHFVSNEEEEILFTKDNFENEKEYTLSIVSMGDGNYENSAPLSTNFVYYTYDNNNNENPTFTIDTLIGKTKNNFEAYFRGLNYDINRFSAQEAETLCTGEEAIILSVSGIYEGESLTNEELQSRNISYTYCKLEKANEQ